MGGDLRLRPPRRNSWDSGDQKKPPETSENGNFLGRRSLAHIFSSFGKGGKQTNIDRKAKMTSVSEKPKRKGTDRTNKAKSQFYIDLTEDNIFDESSSARNGDQVVLNNNSDHNILSVGVDTETGRSLEVPTDPESSCENEINVGRKSSGTQENDSQRNPRERPLKKPQEAFPRGGVGRISKSHTQLGVLVIPDSFCESRLYRERVLSSRESPAAKTMGSDYSKDSNVEEDDDESSTTSNCEITDIAADLPTAAHQQYNFVVSQHNPVVSQLCDYLYTGTPILHSTHHPYHHSYVNNRPPIKPKPKNIPPPSAKVIRSENIRETPNMNRNGSAPGQAAIGIIGGNGPQVVKSESCDSTGNDRDLSREMKGGPANSVPGPASEHNAYTNEKNNCNSATQKHSNQTSDTSGLVDDDVIDSVVEPAHMCKTVTSNTLEAENTLRTIITRDPVDFMSLHKTNTVCVVEPRTLPSEPFTSTTTTTTTSSMSVVSCDTNPIAPPNSFNSPELTPKSSPDLNSTEKREQKIFLIAKELMTSERVFVNVLRLLNIDFRNFIFENMAENLNRISPVANTSNNNNYKVSKSLMQEEDLNKILNYLPQLQNLNEEILKDLEGRITDWERHRKISDVIVRKGPFLKLYSAYIKEFQSQCDHLDECCQKYPLFAKVVKDFETTEKCAKLSIKHNMLKPVQRIPQYRLLLEDYLKKLPDDSVDYVDTQTALAVVSNVASHANDTMKQGTNFMKLLALQDRLTRNQNNDSTGGSDNNNVTNEITTTNTHYGLIRPGRSLLKEGELLKHCRRGMQPRYYILLSDVLLYTSFITSGPGGALRVNYELPLEGMRVETPKAEDFKNEFSVISTSRSFTLQAKSAEERDEWIQALREAIEDNASRRSTFMRAKIPSFQHPDTSSLGKQAPVWIPDNRVTMCQQCTAEFTLTFRRHHCRACGKVVCDHCSANRAPLQYKRNQSLRVCCTCFEVLQKEFECRYEGTSTVEDPQESKLRRVSSLKAQFKRGIKENRSQTRKRGPDRLLEVSASDAASQMCGYLRVMVRRSWRRGWFVLKDRVLYEYRAPQDVRALTSLPVLGYQIEVDKASDIADGIDASLAFQLTHENRPPLIFYTDSPHLAEKWIQAMQEAVVLS